MKTMFETFCEQDEFENVCAKVLKDIIELCNMDIHKTYGLMSGTDIVYCFFAPIEQFRNLITKEVSDKLKEERISFEVLRKDGSSLVREIRMNGDFVFHVGREVGPDILGRNVIGCMAFSGTSHLDSIMGRIKSRFAQKGDENEDE